MKREAGTGQAEWPVNSPTDWREKEKPLDQVIREHPHVSPFVILKADVQRRGVLFSQAALEAADTAVHQMQYSECARAG